MLWLALHCIFGLKVIDSICHFHQMISSSHKICFLFYSFLFFSPFTLDPFYSYKHTENVNKICDAKNLPTSSHSSMNIQNFLKEHVNPYMTPICPICISWRTTKWQGTLFLLDELHVYCKVINQCLARIRIPQPKASHLTGINIPWSPYQIVIWGKNRIVSLHHFKHCTVQEGFLSIKLHT